MNDERENQEIAFRKQEQHPSSSCHHCRESKISHIQEEHYRWENVPKLEVLATLQGQLHLRLAGNTLQSQDNLLCGLSLLVKDGLGLTTITRLLAVVSALSLGE